MNLRVAQVVGVRGIGFHACRRSDHSCVTIIATHESSATQNVLQDRTLRAETLSRPLRGLVRKQKGCHRLRGVPGERGLQVRRVGSEPTTGGLASPCQRTANLHRVTGPNEEGTQIKSKETTSLRYQACAMVSASDASEYRPSIPEYGSAARGRGEDSLTPRLRRTPAGNTSQRGEYEPGFLLPRPQSASAGNAQFAVQPGIHDHSAVDLDLDLSPAISRCCLR